MEYGKWLGTNATYRHVGNRYRDFRETEVTMGGLDAHRRGGPLMQLEGPTAAGLMYPDTGGDGPVVVLLHGVLMNGTLWDTVVGGLGDRYRCVVPELPFGAHTTPMPDDPTSPRRRSPP